MANDLVERLRHFKVKWDGKTSPSVTDLVADAIKALEAADAMAEALEALKCHLVTAAYRAATQKENGDG